MPRTADRLAEPGEFRVSVRPPPPPGMNVGAREWTGSVAAQPSDGGRGTYLANGLWMPGDSRPAEKADGHGDWIPSASAASSGCSASGSDAERRDAAAAFGKATPPPNQQGRQQTGGSRRLCKYFQYNGCSKGASCPFVHEFSQEQPGGVHIPEHLKDKFFETVYMKSSSSEPSSRNPSGVLPDQRSDSTEPQGSPLSLGDTARAIPVAVPESAPWQQYQNAQPIGHAAVVRQGQGAVVRQGQGAPCAEAVPIATHAVAVAPISEHPRAVTVLVPQPQYDGLVPSATPAPPMAIRQLGGNGGPWQRQGTPPPGPVASPASPPVVYTGARVHNGPPRGDEPTQLQTHMNLFVVPQQGGANAAPIIPTVVPCFLPRQQEVVVIAKSEDAKSDDSRRVLNIPKMETECAAEVKGPSWTNPSTRTKEEQENTSNSDRELAPTHVTQWMARIAGSVETAPVQLASAHSPTTDLPSRRRGGGDDWWQSGDSSPASSPQDRRQVAQAQPAPQPPQPEVRRTYAAAVRSAPPQQRAQPRHTAHVQATSSGRPHEVQRRGDDERRREERNKPDSIDRRRGKGARRPGDDRAGRRRGQHTGIHFSTDGDVAGEGALLHDLSSYLSSQQGFDDAERPAGDADRQRDQAGARRNRNRDRPAQQPQRDGPGGRRRAGDSGSRGQ